MSEDLHPGKIPTETFEVGSSRYVISPTMGCRLMKWTLKTVSGDREVLYWPDGSGETPFEKIRGGNPILFPFSGRSYDRGVLYAWRDPNGERRTMPMHGFARQGRFRIAERSDNALTAVLEPDQEALSAYPFEYTFAVRYTFEELSFAVSLILTNLGEERIPWSAGHHFYFNVPWHKGASRQDYQLHMDSRKCACPSPDGKLMMEKDRETCHNLADAKLIERIHWELRRNRVSFGPKGGEEDVHLIMGKDPVPQKNQSVVTWSESGTAPFYCVEPWMGPPNAAEHGKGLHWVAPGEQQSFDVEVSLF
jgi:galactose mutarotase-like enzyme